MKEYFQCCSCNKIFENKLDCENHEKVCGIEDTEYVYVAECFCINQTLHENPRFFSIFKQTVIVNDEFIKKVRNIKEGDYKFIDALFTDDIFINALPSKFTDIIFEKFIMCGSFDNESIYQIIDNDKFMEWYSRDCYPNDDLVCEIHFKNKYKEETDLGVAFLSVYKTEKSKLEKHDDVDIKLRKWVTDNITR